MATVKAVAPIPEKGSAGATPSSGFDLGSLKADIEAAVCQAWQEEMARRRKGDTAMERGVVHESKPAETPPQQAPKATDGTPVTSNISDRGHLCQGVLARVLAAAEEKAVAAYQAALREAQALARKMSGIGREIAAAQDQLTTVASEAQERAEAGEAALQEARARAQEALSPYVAAGVVSPVETEAHLEGALREASEQLQARTEEAQLRLAALQAEVDQRRARQAEVEARSRAIDARLSQLRALPCIAALERACREEEARRREAAQAAVRLLETAPWHELSWQKRLTPRTEQVVALASQDQGVFEALVERLGGELDRVDAATRPGLGWSVVRAIEALEMERLFPNLEARRAELAQAARSYHRERQSGPPLADKIVSLASHWGARVAAR